MRKQTAEAAKRGRCAVGGSMHTLAHMPSARTLCRSINWFNYTPEFI